MAYVQNNGSWLLDFSLMDDLQSGEYLWPAQGLSNNCVPSVLEVDNSPKEGHCREKVSSSKKRVHDDVSEGPKSKACREKIRRDRINNCFLELCSILDPGSDPKIEKVSVLSDAVRALDQLRAEAKKLKDANESLQSTIKGLKGEKVELRDEKVKLKAEKERLEQAIKNMNMVPSFVSHPTAIHPAAFVSSSKMPAAYPAYPPVAMWQWMPQAVVDTSHDHVLRPPVA